MFGCFTRLFKRSPRPGERCASCGIPIVAGAMLDSDLLPRIHRRGLRRCLHFEYSWYGRGHDPSLVPDGPITADNCDSVALPDIVVPEQRCPRCGGLAYGPEMFA